MSFKKILLLFLCLILCFPFNLFPQAPDSVEAFIIDRSRTASLHNGIIRAGINSGGQVYYLTYQGKSMVGGGGRFYFSYNDESDYHELNPNSVKLVRHTADFAEVVYTSTEGPLTIEQSYIMLRGVSGLYTYVKIKSEKQNVKAREIRVVHRVNPGIFTYGYVSDNIQGPMVSPYELDNATQIMDATYELSDSTIYTKYDWANYVADDTLHGLMGDTVGVWVISASDEYLNGGPMKQELMVHATNKTPLMLKMLQGEHFGASAQTFHPGDEKLYGPYFIYFNSGEDHDDMIADAKLKASEEVDLWPYQWMEHPLYPLDRSTVKGKVHTRNDFSPKDLMVVLAQPGETLYNQGKEYMFWAKTDQDGNFIIPHVRPGEYSLYAFATRGEMTGEMQQDNITVSGPETNLGIVSWASDRYEHLLWQIGQSDRKASEFKLGEAPRHYGIWDEVPANLTFDIGSSEDSKDWYYAQTKSGRWTVEFDLDQEYTGDAVLTVAIAGAASEPRIEISVNGSKQETFSFGNDGSVYRSANTGGRYELKIIRFPASLLQIGQNTAVFRLISVGNRGGLMYDTIKLESGDPVVTDVIATDDLCKEFSLKQNYPNPFNPSTKIVFNVPYQTHVQINIFNVTGSKVAELINEEKSAGRHEVEFIAKDLGSGVYLYQMVYGDQVLFRKMLLVK